ncbi:MAG TPA: ATP-binding protein [Pirellulales bacterium]|nr:ATP-binding protein [Pirellulales bacterium]
MLQRTSRKITLWSIAAGVLLLAVGMSGAWYVHVLQGRVAWALADNVTSIRAALKLQVAISQMRNALEQFAISTDRSFIGKAVAMQKDVERAAADVTRFASTATEYGIVAKMNDGLRRYFGQLRELAQNVSAASAPPPPKVDEQILVKDVLPFVKQYLDFNEAELADRSHDNEAMASWIVFALVSLGIGGAAAGAAAGFGLARGIRRTVYQLTIPLRDVAGRLNQVVGPIEIDEDPAIEDLAGVLQKIAAEVNSVIEKFHATHRQVIRADQLAALGQLAAGLAHELHNPLMSIKILVQSARSDGAAALDSYDLRVLDEEITRLQNLLTSFLDFAKPAKLERREIDLRPIVSQTAAILAARAARRNVAIHSCLPDRPVLLDADETQVRQVALNLLLNALDAVADHGSIWIEVGSGRRASFNENGTLTPLPAVFLSVADNGRGLPARDGERIFEPFFSTKETGLGLGLAICRRIAESHGGSIVASNRPGGGAIFLVSLPAKSAASVDQPPPAMIESSPLLQAEGASRA